VFGEIISVRLVFGEIIGVWKDFGGCGSSTASLPWSWLSPAPVAFKNKYFTEMCSGSEAGSYLRLIDLCITPL